MLAGAHSSNNKKKLLRHARAGEDRPIDGHDFILKYPKRLQKTCRAGRSTQNQGTRGVQAEDNTPHWSWPSSRSGARGSLALMYPAAGRRTGLVPFRELHAAAGFGASAGGTRLGREPSDAHEWVGALCSVASSFYVSDRRSEDVRLLFFLIVHNAIATAAAARRRARLAPPAPRQKRPLLADNQCMFFPVPTSAP